MKKPLISLTVLGLGLFLCAGALAEAEAPTLVGTPKCKICHGKKTGNQWTIWSETGHAKAYETLASEEAKKIATEKGLGDPQQEKDCLRCHVTRAFLGCAEEMIDAKGQYDPSEGVGCEACHGAGSAYKKVMKDHEKAVAAGLNTELGEALCLRCHNEESPTFQGFDYQKQWAEIAHPVPDEK